MSAIDVHCFRQSRKGIESVNSIGEVLLSEDVEQNEGKKQLAGRTLATFDFEDVSFHYNNTDDKPVLNHLNLHCKTGGDDRISRGVRCRKIDCVKSCDRLSFGGRREGPV